MNGEPESIIWEEPWRKNYALRIPREAWRPLGRMAWVLLLRPFLIALGPCAAILWWASYRLPPIDLSRLLRLLLKLPAILVFVPISAGIAITFMFRSFHAIFPPVVEVSRSGIRLATRRFSHARLRSLQLSQERGRWWVTFEVSNWERGKVEVSPDVDLAKLRSLIDTRDVRATDLPDAPPGWPFAGRLLLGVAVSLIELALLGVMYAVVFQLVLGGESPSTADPS